MNPNKEYNYDYYIKLVDQIVGTGTHILGVKAS